MFGLDSYTTVASRSQCRGQRPVFVAESQSRGWGGGRVDMQGLGEALTRSSFR